MAKDTSSAVFLLDIHTIEHCTWEAEDVFAPHHQQLVSKYNSNIVIETGIKIEDEEEEYSPKMNAPVLVEEIEKPAVDLNLDSMAKEIGYGPLANVAEADNKNFNVSSAKVSVGDNDKKT